MRIRPSELGWKGLLLFAALACAFLATAYSNLFFLVLVFCTALGCFAATWTLANVRGLEVVRLEVPAAPAGAERVARCELRAKRPRLDLQLELVVDDGVAPFGAAAVVAPTAAIAGSIPARARGVTNVRAVRVTSRHPLGLFVARVDLPVAGEIVTHAAPFGVGTGSRAAGEQAGDDTPGAAARSATAQELRGFRAGDSLGDVHWKATARRGEPIVKVREREAAHDFTIVLDRRCAPEALERALSELTEMVLRRVDRPLSLRVVSQDAVFPLRGEAADAGPLLRWTALATTLPAEAPPPAATRANLRLPRPARSTTEARS